VSEAAAGDDGRAAPTTPSTPASLPAPAVPATSDLTLPGPCELYVYYCVRPGAEAAARAAVLAAQTALVHNHAGLAARLLRRAGGERDDGETWMETYARPTHPAGIDAALEAAIECSVGAAVAAHLVDGRRHIETFCDNNLKSAPT